MAKFCLGITTQLSHLLYIVFQLCILFITAKFPQSSVEHPVVKKHWWNTWLHEARVKKTRLWLVEVYFRIDLELLLNDVPVVHHLLFSVHLEEFWGELEFWIWSHVLGEFVVKFDETRDKKQLADLRLVEGAFVTLFEQVRIHDLALDWAA